MGYDDDDSKSSKFNAGVEQARIFSEILRLINFCKINPAAFNMEYQDYNFIIWLRCVDSMYDHFDAYVNEDEAAKCLNMGEGITQMIEKYPIVEDKRTKPDEVKKIVNRNNLKILEKAMREYERLVKSLGVKYQLLSATVDSGLEGL